MGGLTLSKEHGVNPSVRCCECCGQDIDVVLFGSRYKDPKTGKHTKAPDKIYGGLCDRCQSVVDQGGMMIIEVRDGEKSPNPYRTGRVIGITKEAKEEYFSEYKDNSIIYMEQSVFEPMFGEHCKKSEENVSK